MKLIPNAVYKLSGYNFSDQALADNDHLFRFTGEIDEDGFWTFEGIINQTRQFACQTWLDEGDAFIKPQYPAKEPRPKRKKGKRRLTPTVNKATILFMSGERYTVKDFVSIEVTANEIVFVMEQNYKGTVEYSQKITVPNDDVCDVKVRGVNHRFVLDMTLSNTGVVVFQASGVQMFTSSINMTV